MSAIRGNGAAERMDGIRDAEVTVTVAARPLESHAISEAADADGGDAESSAVDRHESIDASFEFTVEELLDAAQVAEPFLPHRTHKCNRAGSLNVCLLERAHYAEKYRETATIVADPRTFDDRTGRESS